MQTKDGVLTGLESRYSLDGLTHVEVALLLEAARLSFIAIDLVHDPVPLEADPFQRLAHLAALAPDDAMSLVSKLLTLAEKAKDA